jgi:tetratricopeptide (TPR) repeat protein
LLIAVPAAADDTQSARAHYARGTKLFDLGRYLEAAKEYEATYELKDDPAILFNLGQAYRLGHDYASAMRAYKSFLRRAPDSSQRPTVESFLAEMQSALEKERSQAQQAPAPPPAVATPPAPAPAPVTTSTAPPTHERQPLYKKWWLWTIVGGVVVAGVVVGVSVGVVSSRDSFNPSLGKLGPGASLAVSF